MDYQQADLSDSDQFTVYRLEELADSLQIASEAIKEAARLRAERDYWKGQYNELLNSSIKHGEKMKAGMLALALKDSMPETAKRIAKNIAGD